MSTHSALFSQTEASFMKQTNDSLLTRRGVLKLLATGALSLATLNLTGCLRSRKMLALDLLREKYDREFDIVFETYTFNTSREPKAFCCAASEPDLVFDLDFSVAERKIIRDTYVGRKLGRQAENILTGCLEEQGIKSVTHGDIDTFSLGANLEEEFNPDIPIDIFIEKYHEVRISASIVVTNQIESPRTSPQFAEAMIKAFHLLGDTQSSMNVYVVKESDFEEYRNHFLSHPWFQTSVMVLDGQPVDLFYIDVEESELVISEKVYR